MPIARIIIVAYNSNNFIDKCLAALKNQTRKDFEVIIVDNNLDADASSKWKIPDARFTVVSPPRNDGFAGGSNFGAIGANTKWIITINPDAYPRENWFELLMTAAENNPEYAMLSTSLISANDPNIIDGAGDSYSIFGVGWRGGHGKPTEILPEKNYEVLGPCGAVACYRRAEFEQVDGFDSAYFCYLEDIDIAFRLQFLGHKCLHVVQAVSTHVSGGSTGINSHFQLYHTAKNQVRLIVKLMPVPLLLLVVPLHLFLSGWILLRNRKLPYAKARLVGLRDGIFQIHKTMKCRKNIHNSRILSIAETAKLITWSPFKLRNRPINPLK